MIVDVDLERNYKAKEMAEHFNVSVGTIYRHLRLMKISLRVHRRSIQQGSLILSHSSYKIVVLIFNLFVFM